jgi:hypothetical protein
MDSHWSTPLDVNPRDLELDQINSLAYEISTFLVPQTDSFNDTTSGPNPWPNVAALQGSFVPTGPAGTSLEIGTFDSGMAALGQGDFQFNKSVETVGM